MKEASCEIFCPTLSNPCGTSNCLCCSRQFPWHAGLNWSYARKGRLGHRYADTFLPSENRFRGDRQRLVHVRCGMPEWRLHQALISCAASDPQRSGQGTGRLVLAARAAASNEGKHHHAQNRERLASTERKLTQLPTTHKPAPYALACVT